MATENSQQRVSWDVAFGISPTEGSQVMPQVLDFSIENPIGINLGDDQVRRRLQFAQALFIDNSANPYPLSCTMHTINQLVIIPAGWQGYVPILASMSHPKITFATSGTPLVPVFFLSFPVPAMLWPANGNASNGSVGTDYSSTAAIAAAGVVIAANLILSTVPVNAKRNYLEVQNQSLDTIYLICDDGAGNQVSLTILNPGFAVGAQGAAWTNEFFKGRLRVYTSVAGSQVSVREE